MSKKVEQFLSFDKICRLCLAEKRSMSSIFSSKDLSSSEVPLHQKIMSCASVVMYDGDGLPAQICSKCLLAVNQSYALRGQVEQADAQLQRMLLQMNEQTEETKTTQLEIFGGRADDTNDVDYKWAEESQGEVEYLEEEPYNEEDKTVDTSLHKQDELTEGLPDVLDEDSAGGGYTLLLVENSMDNEGDGVASETDDIVEEQHVVVCPICALVFSPDDLPTHMTIHGFDASEINFEEPQPVLVPAVVEASPAKSKKECMLCNFVAVERGGLWKHMREVHGNGSQTLCSSCGKHVWTKLFDKHISDVHNDVPGVCSQCGEEVEQLKLHLRETHDAFRLCTICRIDVPSDMVENHVTQVHVGGSYFCEVCNKEFFDVTCYKNHVRYKHVKDKMYICPRCNFSTPYLSSMNKHISGTHIQSERYVCELCAKVFLVKGNLLKHIRTTHDAKTRTVCVVCGKICFANRELMNHMRLHTGDLPFHCEFCGRRFPKKSSWEIHRRIHTGEKQFKCSFCAEAFRINSQLKVHLFREHGVEEYRHLDRRFRAKTLGTTHPDRSPNDSSLYSDFKEGFH